MPRRPPVPVFPSTTTVFCPSPALRCRAPPRMCPARWDGACRTTGRRVTANARRWSTPMSTRPGRGAAGVPPTGTSPARRRRGPVRVRPNRSAGSSCGPWSGAGANGWRRCRGVRSARWRTAGLTGATARGIMNSHIRHTAMVGCAADCGASETRGSGMPAARFRGCSRIPPTKRRVAVFCRTRMSPCGMSWSPMWRAR